MKVKICGITNQEDATVAVRAGAHALGFVFAPSPRRVTADAARAIVAGLPPGIQAVGVFVDEDPGEIRQLVEFCGLDLVQLHGSESPDTCLQLMPRAIKALRARDATVVQQASRYLGTVRALLLDAYVPGKVGGTGITFDWALAVQAKRLGLPLVLSGGLNPANVAAAVSRVRPHMVDVSSGIESQPGKKDPLLARQFVAAAMEAAALVEGAGALC